MKQFMLALLLLGAISCRTQEEVVTTVESSDNQEQEQTSTDNRLVGVVHISDEGCPVYIDAMMNEDMVMMYPVNLEDRYKVEGMRIRYTYALSKAPVPEGCDVKMTISLTDVTRLR